MPPYLTPTPKLMETPNLALALVSSKFYQKPDFELMTSLLWRHGFIFEKWPHFSLTSQTVQILHISLFFDTESRNAYLKLVTSQKRHITSLQLIMDQKRLRFRKVTSKNLKNWKLAVVLVASNFQDLFISGVNSKKNFFLKGFISKKTRGRQKSPLPAPVENRVKLLLRNFKEQVKKTLNSGNANKFNKNNLLILTN